MSSEGTPRMSELTLEDEEDTELEGDVIKLNPDLLDCPICQDLLKPPILQCSNGHIACSSCISKIHGKKCPYCSLPTGHIRNRGLEAVVEGARISCSFRTFGCLAFVSYSQKVAHEADCHCAPCFCPITGCDFQWSWINLTPHILVKHGRAITNRLNYTQTMNLHLFLEDSFAIVLDGSSPVFLVAISSDHIPSGSSIMLVCLRPSTDYYSHFSYTYELTVIGSNGCKLQLKDKPIYTRRWSGDFAANNFLYVPHQMANTDRSLQIMLRIRFLHQTETEQEVG